MVKWRTERWGWRLLGIGTVLLLVAGLDLLLGEPIPARAIVMFAAFMCAGGAAILRQYYGLWGLIEDDERLHRRRARGFKKRNTAGK